MIVISFIIGNTPEEKIHKLLQEIASRTIAQINKTKPNAIITGTPWIFRRESNKPGEPSIMLITDTLEQYLSLTTKAIDRPNYQTWVFDIQCPTHAMAIPDRNHPKFHILEPDQVSTLFLNLAKTLSTLVKVEVSYNDDNTRTSLIFQKGKPTKEEHW